MYSKDPPRVQSCLVTFQEMRYFVLYETKSKFYIVGNTKASEHAYRILKIDRTQGDLSLVEDSTEYTWTQLNELLTMIDNGNKATGGLKKVCSFSGIVGICCIIPLNQDSFASCMATISTLSPLRV